MKRLLLILALSSVALLSSAQKYQQGLVDKTVAVVGNELITLSDLEREVEVVKSQGYSSDRNVRCEVLENFMQAKLFLMKARLDSLNANMDIVEAELSQRIDQVRTALGGDKQVEDYFKKPIYKLRQEWRAQLEESTLIQQAQSSISEKIPTVTPYDVKQYLDTADVDDLPVVPIKYKMSQICIYPDRDSAALAVKERLLSLRERIINGEKFSTLARLYSQDPGSARKGGELGMASKSIFWPAFSDMAMSLKPGVISQIVETPDGFHIIEILDKKGDMFNARHILLKPEYTEEDKEKAFAKLDTIRVNILEKDMPFELAARIYSQDPATRTNGGQMADPTTGSAYFEIDQLHPQDYEAVKDLEIGQISEPIQSLDEEGRDGNLVYKIVRLDKILPAHTATFENDYNDLLAQVKYAKQLEAVSKYVDETIKTTYIQIDPLFKGCKFKKAGWATKIRED